MTFTAFQKVPVCSLPSSIYPLPRSNPCSDLFHHRFVLPVLDLHVNGILQYTCWYLASSFNSISIYIVEYESGLFLLLCNDIWIYCSLCSVLLMYIWIWSRFRPLCTYIFWRRNAHTVYGYILSGRIAKSWTNHTCSFSSFSSTVSLNLIWTLNFKPLPWQASELSTSPWYFWVQKLEKG